MSEDKTDAADVEELKFEEALEQLEAIVNKLESGQVNLEASIAIYERGEKLKARCEALLREAEARIEKITLKPDGSAGGAEPLEVD
jgi:exodeoxyribonuclease VII small subunit